MAKYTTRTNSRLARQENRRLAQQTVLIFIVTILLLAAFLVYGIPALIKLAVYLGNSKNGVSTEQQDTIPPSTPQLTIPPEATNSAALTFSGYAESNSTLVLYHNGFKSKEVVVGEDGQFSTGEVTLEPGENRFFAVAIDAATNESAHTPTHLVIFNNTPPELTITAPADGAGFYGALQQTLTIQGQTVKGATVKVNDLFLVVGSEGNFSGRMQLSEGDNHLTITATDPSGNQTTKELTVKYSKN